MTYDEQIASLDQRLVSQSLAELRAEYELNTNGGRLHEVCQQASEAAIWGRIRAALLQKEEGNS